MASEPEIAESLLRGPVAEDTGDRWAYRGVGRVLISLFVLYHVVALLQHTTPAGGLAQRFNRKLAETLHIPGYMRATSSVQSWAMFAPNPHRSNMFLQVRVELADGQELDLLHDMYGRRDYPYFFYDRMGKINRRLIEQERYQKTYAAWVCRDWALSHGGVPPVRVKFTKMWTKVPPPQKAFTTMGFDPFELKLFKENLPSHDCATTLHAQLPDNVRARHGLPPLPPGSFRDVNQTTWYDRAELKAKILERRRAAEASREEREQQRDEREQQRDDREDEPPPAEVGGAAEGGGD